MLDSQTFIKRISIFASIISIYILVYLPVITHNYGFADDYSVTFTAHHHILSLLYMVVSSGRPVYALFNFIFSLTSDIADFRWVRLTSIFGIATLAQIIATFFIEETDLPRSLSVSAALLIGLMPAFQVYASWTVCAGYPWAAAIAAFSFCVLHRNQYGGWRVSLISFILLTLAMMIYQPAAMMYWVVAAAAWVANDRPLPSCNRIVRAVSIMMAALLADFISTKILTHFVFHHYYTLSRTALATNIAQKLSWFVSIPLIDGLNFISITASQTVTILFGVFIFIGLSVFILKDNKSKPKKAMLSFALIPMSYLPNLIVDENLASYRTQSALSSLLTLYAAVALVAWLRLFRIPRFAPVVALVALLSSAGVARNNVITEFVNPQTAELKLVSRYLKMHTNNLKGAKQIYIVPSHWQETLAPVVRYDEFGMPSSADQWVPKGMVWLLLKSEHEPTASKLSTAKVGPLSAAPKGSTVVDLAQAISSR